MKGNNDILKRYSPTNYSDIDRLLGEKLIDRRRLENVLTAFQSLNNSESNKYNNDAKEARDTAQKMKFFHYGFLHFLCSEKILPTISYPNRANQIESYKSSRTEVLCKKGVLRNFAKFTGKHLCKSLFFNRVAGLRPDSLD